jgi:hypothetical protein
MQAAAVNVGFGSDNVRMSVCLIAATYGAFVYSAQLCPGKRPGQRRCGEGSPENELGCLSSVAYARRGCREEWAQLIGAQFERSRNESD